MSNEDTMLSKTLWSETLIEMLIIALVANKPDEQIKELLNDCKNKGFKKSYLVEKVRKEMNDKSAHRVQMIIDKL